MSIYNILKNTKASSGRNKFTAILLTFFLGFIGIHKFYLGRVEEGVLCILFSWTLIPLIIALIDLVFFSLMSDYEFLKYCNE